MKVEVRVSKSFKRQSKRYLKKYPSLKKELFDLQKQLQEKPDFGIKLGINTFKIRIKVKSKGKGKSGGLRAITFVEEEIIVFREQDNDDKVIVNLIAIYDKSETASISENEIKKLIREQL